jgi:hypothetical protein
MLVSLELLEIVVFYERPENCFTSQIVQEFVL